MKNLLKLACAATIAVASSWTPSAQAGGTLQLQGSAEAPIQIRDHHVEVVIQNGYARTEVTQTFYNPNAVDLEAIYRVPVPEGASLSEMTMQLGENTLQGEVVARDKAREAYEQEKDKGAGLAEENEGRVYDFSVSPVPAQGELSFRYLYYQPVTVDTGVGRYHYPLEDGGTDEVAASFWTQETTVQRSFSFHTVIESAWPLVDVRVPGVGAAAQVKDLGNGRWDVLFEAPGGIELTGDLIVYYRLADHLPGRVEMIAHRPDPALPGTFMMVVTPGVDLAELTGGVDYVFVLDTSGSMRGKLGTLTDGVIKALGQLNPDDRFRIITFSNRAQDLTEGFRPATQNEVTKAVSKIKGVPCGGGTDLYAGIQKSLRKLDADRATSVILVTDGVANQGIVNPQKFDKLMRSHDVRLFGFLLGNSGNWPLMRTITEASGGFYAAISNADDVIGQIMLAKSKITHAAMHDATLSIKGVRTFDTNLGPIGKIYRGQQLVTFGRYSEAGKATVALQARLTGENKVYSTTFDFPEHSLEHPELERMWALNRIHTIQLNIDRGKTSEEEGNIAIRDLAIAYQLVTDETSMVVLSDAAFKALGIDRKNRDRVQTERIAQAAARQAPVVSRRVDQESPAFSGNAPRLGGGSGGGAFGPWALALAALLSGLALRGRKAKSLEVQPLPVPDGSERPTQLG